MKPSTKIKKYVDPSAWSGLEAVPIVLMVDCEKEYASFNLDRIDEYHDYLTKYRHCTLLPLNECPVYNGKAIIMHYTSTTYREWCNR